MIYELYITIVNIAGVYSGAHVLFLCPFIYHNGKGDRYLGKGDRYLRPHLSVSAKGTGTSVPRIVGCLLPGLIFTFVGNVTGKRIKLS